MSSAAELLIAVVSNGMYEHIIGESLNVMKQLYVRFIWIQTKRYKSISLLLIIKRELLCLSLHTRTISYEKFAYYLSWRTKMGKTTFIAYCKQGKESPQLGDLHIS